jgi:hypothetical protein
MKKDFMPFLLMTLVEVFLVFINFLIHQLIGGGFFLKTNKKIFVLGNALPFRNPLAHYLRTLPNPVIRIIFGEE